jgi:16S rRNA A1518/A1519 N6-dimethyltransferase RsmA/KsgA/DIM1 with predicted DNA glycosylase/AP lyase activity
MQTKSQDLIKAIVSQVDSLFDARNKTLESNLKIYIDKTVKEAIKASEKRQNKRLQTAIQVISRVTKVDILITKNELIGCNRQLRIA